MPAPSVGLLVATNHYVAIVLAIFVSVSVSRAADTKATTALPQITVEGRRVLLKKRLSSYVAQITSSKNQNESLPRWHKPICFRVLGLPDEQKDYVVKRVAKLAQSIGAAFAGNDCATNFIAMVTPDPNSVLELWKHMNNGPFANAWPLTVNDFLESKKPARTWYVDSHSA